MRDMILAHLSQAVPFAAHVGVELVEMGDGEAKARLAERPEGLNHIATHHAGALFTLAEAASGAAMAGAFAPVLMGVRPVAAAAKIDYRRPAKGLITANAKTGQDGAALLSDLEANGKVRFGVHVTLQDEAGQEVAVMDVDWHVSKPRAA